ncbi:queuosine precursor transporter [Methylobacterium iners]|uniref:Probable queuosine precursor transporter n=1 Tax=Methylobacterium iners TaxID=418707 RepID=A0ABQ4RTS3_9HYPH|nr:queuosine precursor transporter [Methylobacterium iners]GJD94191.1 queuosine precursor transporter [Methylobacterium iners]
MPPTVEPQRKHLVPIAGLFSAVLIISLILAGKIVALGGLTFSAAVIVFPLSYVFGDVLTEVYGYASARRVVWAGLTAQVVWIAAYTLAAALPPAPFWPHQAAFETVLGATPRFAVAGMAAYLAGEFLNAYVLAKLKLRLAGRRLALRLVASTMVGQGVDTLIFVGIAFGGVFGTAELVRIGLGAWALKVAWEIVALPLTLPLIAWLKREEGEDHFDRDTDFSPFRLRE